MKFVGKLLAVLVLGFAAHFAVVEQTTFASPESACSTAQAQRRKCRAFCGGSGPCLDRCDQAFLSTPGVDLDCWNGRDRPPIQP